MPKILPSRLLVMVFMSLALLLQAGIGFAEVVDRIVAEVNDDIITQSELDAMARSIQAHSGQLPKGKDAQGLKREMLEAMVDRKLARAEAKKRGITVADKDVDQAMEEFKKNNKIPDDDALNQALSKAGLTLKEFRQQIADQLQQQRLIHVAVATKANVSEADVRRAYDEHFKEGGDQLHLRSIKMPYPPGATEAQKEEMKRKAEAALQDCQKGVSFAEIARKYSVSQTDMGLMSKSDLDPRLVEFLSRLKPGEVAPLQTSQGFQLIQLVKRQSGGQARTYEEAAPEIRKILLQRDMAKQFSEWIKTLRAKAHVKIML
jgi:peptidyl-prolyl cis-trans isomerase SurA